MQRLVYEWVFVNRVLGDGTTVYLRSGTVYLADLLILAALFIIPLICRGLNG